MADNYVDIDEIQELHEKGFARISSRLFYYIRKTILNQCQIW